MPYLVALAVVLLVGGGVTVVSNNSLPGDTLYPIKGASETVRTVLNVSEKGEAEIKAIARRAVIPGMLANCLR